MQLSTSKLELTFNFVERRNCVETLLKGGYMMSIGGPRGVQVETARLGVQVGAQSTWGAALHTIVVQRSAEEDVSQHCSNAAGRRLSAALQQPGLQLISYFVIDSCSGCRAAAAATEQRARHRYAVLRCSARLARHSALLC